MNQSEQLVRAQAQLMGDQQNIATRMLVKYGRPYTHKHTMLTATGEMGLCYSNTFNLLGTEGSYCEGYACPRGLIPLSHAWLAQGETAIDPTWAGGSDYFGVLFSWFFVTDMALRTGYYGVFEGLHRLRMTPDACFEYLESGVLS